MHHLSYTNLACAILVASLGNFPMGLLLHILFYQVLIPLEDTQDLDSPLAKITGVRSSPCNPSLRTTNHIAGGE